MVAPEEEAEKPKPESLHINFGKTLAHTDKKVRDKGFKNLKTWLRKHPELERLDYLKLWKGLYFGMWMSDKRPVQQELAVQMALVINDIPRPKHAIWLDTFWETMQSSWENIDKFRMSKYLLFIRIVVAEAFKVVRVGGWQPSEVKTLSDTFLRKVPRTSREGSNVPSVGLNLQFNRAFWDELRPQLAMAPEPSDEVVMDFLEPFILVAQGTCMLNLVRNIHKYILLMTPQQYVGKLIFRLLQGAAQKEIQKGNREALYETVDLLEKRPQAPAKPAAAAAAPPKPSVPAQGAAKTSPAPAAAASPATGKASPMKKKKRQRSSGEGAEPPAGDGPKEPAELPKRKKLRGGSAAGASPAAADAAADAATGQLSPLRLPKAAVPARARQAAKAAEEAAPAAEGQEATSGLKTKKKKRGVGGAAANGSPKAAAPAGGAAGKSAKPLRHVKFDLKATEVVKYREQQRVAREAPVLARGEKGGPKAKGHRHGKSALRNAASQ